MSGDDTGKHKPDGWQVWGKMVLSQLEMFRNHCECVDKRMRDLETQLAILKTKLALYVAAATAVIAIGAEIVRHIVK